MALIGPKSTVRAISVRNETVENTLRRNKKWKRQNLFGGILLDNRSNRAACIEQLSSKPGTKTLRPVEGRRDRLPKSFTTACSVPAALMKNIPTLATNS
jgi:hypothetical protein